MTSGTIRPAMTDIPPPAATPHDADPLRPRVSSDRTDHGPSAPTLAPTTAPGDRDRDLYLRALADLENVRRRHQQELRDAEIRGREKVLVELLPVLDSLERAALHEGARLGSSSTERPSSGADSVLDGLGRVVRQFLGALERLGVSPIDAEGRAFDPSLHEAISRREGDEEPGTVVQVFERGYRLDPASQEGGKTEGRTRLLRPARVVVAAPRS
jgi:molecular chaperone GrpE